MDTIALIEANAAALKSVAAGVSSSQLGNPTPCGEFNVKELTNHMAGFWGRAAMVARNQTSDSDDQPEDIIGNDPGGVINALVDDGVIAWQTDGATMAERPFGPGIVLFEELLHGWDLAVATGQTMQVTPEGAERLLDLATKMCTDERRGEGKPFGDEVTVSGDASAFDRALGLTGRDPNWSA
jgi:uncharacterized protein (TIGR03086 family)